MFSAVEYQRQERSKTDAAKMKLSKWPDSRVPRRASLSRTFYYDRSRTARRVGQKKQRPACPQPEGETNAAPLYPDPLGWNGLGMCGGASEATAEGVSMPV